MSAGSAIQQAAEAAAARRAGGGGQEGDFGLNTGTHGRQVGNLEILSDTQGVDFGPYLQRILEDVPGELVSPDSGVGGNEERKAGH